MKKLSNRQQFERWMNRYDDTYSLERIAEGDYEQDAVYIAWNIWQYQQRKHKKFRDAAIKLARVDAHIAASEANRLFGDRLPEHHTPEQIVEQANREGRAYTVDYAPSTSQVWGRRFAWLAVVILIIVYAWLWIGLVIH